MSSVFDYQTNCLTEPERELVWTFLLVSLDPFTPGVLKDVYDLAWSTASYAAEEREAAFRASFELHNVVIAEVEFVVSFTGEWFGAWADSIGVGDSDPIGDCPCDGF